MNKPQFGTFCWNELSTPNVSAAKKFYADVFGWKFNDHVMGDMTYTMILSGDKEFGGMWQIPTDKIDEVPPHWMGYISVEDIQLTVKKAESLGAVVKMPISKAGDYGLFAVFMDPTGAHIAVWESLEVK